jgi:hypothetical protein
VFGYLQDGIQWIGIPVKQEDIGDRLSFHGPSIALGMQLAVKAEITNSTNKRADGTNLPSMKDSN